MVGPPQVPHDHVCTCVCGFWVLSTTSQGPIHHAQWEGRQSVFLIPRWSAGLLLETAASTQGRTWDWGGQRLHTESTECAVVSAASLEQG